MKPTKTEIKSLNDRIDKLIVENEEEKIKRESDRQTHKEEFEQLNPLIDMSFYTFLHFLTYKFCVLF